MTSRLTGLDQRPLDLYIWDNGQFNSPSDPNLLYRRQLDPAGEDSLARLLRRIPAASRVLELGPATGYFTRYLKEELGCTVDGVELSAEMAEQAGPWLRHLVVGDIESLDASAFPGESYDVIVCADVLEHLRDPWAVMRRLAPLLDAGGRLLLSVPNVGYMGLLVDLLHGNFHYRDEGLLDRSHLRFFTIESLRSLLQQTGWHLWGAEQVTVSLIDSEFHLRLETIAPVLRDELMARPDALCYQWVVEARRDPPAVPCELPTRSSEDMFQVRVFWRDEETNFDYPRNCLVWAALGAEQQVAVMDIPPSQRALALRLTDRVGFIRIHAIRLFADGNAPLWIWVAGQGTLPIAEQIGVEAADEKNLWFVWDTESRLVLDLPAATVAAARRIEVEVGSSLSPDFIAAQSFWNAPDGLPARLMACEASRQRLARRHAGDILPGIPSPEHIVVLHVLSAGGGGVERFVRDVCNSTADRFRHFVLRVTETSWLLEDAATASYWPFQSNTESILSLLARLCPGLVHLHSTAPHSVRAARVIARRCGVPFGLTLHDILFVDQTAFNASNWQWSAATPMADQSCLLADAEFVTAPSDYIAKLANQVYRVSPMMVPNGAEIISRPNWTDLGEVEIGGKIWPRRIVTLGALGGHKGGEHLFDVSSKLPADTVMIVIGFLDGQLETGWASEHHRLLAEHPGAARVFVSGPYAPVDLPALFAYYRPQLVYFPGKIPESFSYTLSETWACGGIPVVPEIGALGERTDASNAIKFPYLEDAASVANRLDEWSRDDAANRRLMLRESIRVSLSQLIPSLQNMAKTFSNLYEKISTRPPKPVDVNVLNELASLCEMSLDPLQFRTELRLMLDQVNVIRAQADESRRWNNKLEADIVELKGRNTVVEQQLADLSQAHNELADAYRVLDNIRAENMQLLERTRCELETIDAKLATTNAELATTNAEFAAANAELAAAHAELAAAHTVIGDDPAEWPRLGRILRLARKIPGFMTAIDNLAKFRRSL